MPPSLESHESRVIDRSLILARITDSGCGPSWFPSWSINHFGTDIGYALPRVKRRGVLSPRPPGRAVTPLVTNTTQVLRARLSASAATRSVGPLPNPLRRAGDSFPGKPTAFVAGPKPASLSLQKFMRHDPPKLDAMIVITPGSSIPLEAETTANLALDWKILTYV